ncbi:MAG TPA: zinc ribbon domain-containing protein [Candidatus Limnocylindrales bacterium]|nr:zinc ribbon domain-containing protein [Candidatus Limnocylindrales bacterium]
MPTYDYLCSSCGRRVEIVHPIQGGPPEACPSCGAVATLRKSFAPPTILFKGTGWAKRDRAAAKASSKAASDGSKDGDAEASSDKGSTTGATSGTSGDRSKGSGSGEAGGTGTASTPATTAKADSSGD